MPGHDDGTLAAPAPDVDDAPPGDATRPPARSDLVRVVAVAVAALAQIVGSPLGAALPGARSVAEVSDTFATVVTPAGYAFAIWGVIFALCLAYAVYQALPAQHGRQVHRRVGWPLAVAFGANAVWEVVFPQEGVWLLVANGLILVTVTATALALGRLQDPEPTGVDRVLPTVAASLLLGWVTIATVANVAISGVHLGAPTGTALASGAGIVALVAAAAVVLDVSLRLRVAAGPFAAAAGWGVLAVALNEPPTPVRLAAWFALAVIGVGVLAQVWRTRRLVRTVLA
ncbi:TspO/MBR family protein [Jannaschia sp. R86511]|uniref:TspO/MBR family protein n=1 Tax=Jannaschia sp. R86511 TaxID=3093853 RepID=UPI0036D21D22